MSITSIKDQQLFTDSLNILIAQFEAANTKLITKRWSVTRKIQQLATVLVHFQTDLYKNLIKFLKSFNNSKQKNNQNIVTKTIDKLAKQFEQSQIKLKKLQLHNLLKKKIRKIQKQSMMHSISMSQDHIVQNLCSQSFIEEQDPQVTKLKHSVLLIQKDLGMNQQSDKIDNDVSFIVHRSMAISTNRSMFHEFEGTPIAHRIPGMNQSVLSNISDLKSQQYPRVFDKSHIDIQKMPQVNEQGEYTINSTFQINEQIITKTKNKVETEPIQSTIKQQKNTINIKSNKPPVPHKTTSKKKKSTVYSSKQSVLGNLLEESYNMCLQTDQPSKS